MIHTTTWMNPENITFHKRSQLQKTTYSYLYGMSRTGKGTKTKVFQWLWWPRAGRQQGGGFRRETEGEGRITANQMEFVSEVMKIS